MALIGRKAAEAQLDGYLGPGTEIEGTVRFADVLRVDGKVRGKIISERDLVVGQAGSVEADVEVGTLTVAGRVSGKIVINERMEISPGGRVSGEIHMRQPRLVIEDGGVFEGSVAMGGAAEAGGEVRGFPSRAEGKAGVS